MEHQLGNEMQKSSQYIATESQQQLSQRSAMESSRQEGGQAAATTIADYSDDLALMDCDDLFEGPEYDFSAVFGTDDDITKKLLDSSINFGPWDEWPSPFHDDEFEMLANFGVACDEPAIHDDNQQQFINNNGISTSTHDQQQSVSDKGKAPMVVDGAAGPSSSSFLTVPSGGNDSSTNSACSLGTLHIVTDNYKRVLGDEFVPDNYGTWSSGNMTSTGGDMIINGSSGPGANVGGILTAHYGQQLLINGSSHQQQSVSTNGNSYQELISNRKWMPTQENQASSSSHWGGNNASTNNNFGVVVSDQHAMKGIITRNFANILMISPSMISGCGGQGFDNNAGGLSDHHNNMIDPTIGTTSANLNGTHGSPMKSSADQDYYIRRRVKRAKKGNREGNIGEPVKKRSVGRPPKGSTSSANKKPRDDSKNALVISAHSIQVGEWKRISNTGCDLSLKCYFGFHQLVWEFLCEEKEEMTTVKVKYRMVVDWKNILSIKTHTLTNGHDVLQVKLNHKPKFDRENGPVCKKHSTWKPCLDFTWGEALKSLMIHLEFKPGLLSSKLNTMLKGSSELRQLFENPSPHVSSSTVAMLPNTLMQSELVVQGQVHDSSHAMQLVHPPYQLDSFQSRADMSVNIQGIRSGAYEQSDGTNSQFYNPP